jgi:hypothetical protein
MTHLAQGDQVLDPIVLPVAVDMVYEYVDRTRT